MELEDRIKELLETLLEKKNSYLVDLKVRPNQLVQIFVDRDPHITIEDCVSISRGLQSELNKQFPFSERYVLEVSSPGMDQPLKVLRQYKKSVGRDVDVVLHSGEKRSGMLMYADEEKIILEERSGSKSKPKEAAQVDISFIDIKSTSVVIKF